MARACVECGKPLPADSCNAAKTHVECRAAHHARLHREWLRADRDARERARHVDQSGAILGLSVHAFGGVASGGAGAGAAGAMRP